jgi:hypothetical protein
LQNEFAKLRRQLANSACRYKSLRRKSLSFFKGQFANPPRYQALPQHTNAEASSPGRETLASASNPSGNRSSFVFSFAQVSSP